MFRNSRYWTVCRVCNTQLRGMHLHKHYKEAHNAETDLLNFESEDDFFEWKSSMEKETMALFVLSRGADKRRCGSLTRYYRCHRDGYYRPRSSGKKARSIKIQGSNKIDGHCPACLTVRTKPNGQVMVEFVRTHIGHTQDLGRLSLTRQEKELVAAKMWLNVPRSEIIEDFKRTMDDSGISRLLLLKRSDFHNIQREFNLPKITVTSKAFPSADDAWVNFVKGTSEVIRLYKPRGEILEAYPFLEQDDFCVVFADDAQLGTMTKYGQHVICVDTITRPNVSDYQLFVVIAGNEEGDVQPCGFMLSTRNDSLVMELFYKSLKLRYEMDHEITPAYFMADIADPYFTGWSALYPCEETQRLYNIWHVEEAWKDNLVMISNQQLQTFVNKQLMLLLSEKDQSTFESMSANFLQVLYSDSETRQFAMYFESFIQDPNPWASCFREKINSEAISDLHREIEDLFLGGSESRTVENDILDLMQLSRTKVLDRVILNSKVRVKPRASINRSRHIAATMMSTDFVQTNDDGSWLVLSGTEGPTVTLSERDCPGCALLCKECGVCVHRYHCTCVDSSVCWNMCVHIHLVGLVNVDANQFEALVTDEEYPVAHLNDDVVIYDVDSAIDLITGAAEENVDDPGEVADEMVEAEDVDEPEEVTDEIPKTEDVEDADGFIDEVIGATDEAIEPTDEAAEPTDDAAEPEYVDDSDEEIQVAVYPDDADEDSEAAEPFAMRSMRIEKEENPAPPRLAKITAPNTILKLEKARYVQAIHELLDVVDNLDEMNVLWSHLNPVAPALEQMKSMSWSMKSREGSPPTKKTCR